MSSVLRNSNNIHSLHVMARESSVDILENMLEKLRIVTEERRDEEEQLQCRRTEQQAKINTLLAQIQADGINPEELLSIAPAVTRSVKECQLCPTEYHSIDLNGGTKTWAGQGRTPRSATQTPTAGKSLDDFLI